MTKEFSLEELADTLVNNTHERFEDKRLIRKTLSTDLPDVPGEVAYNGLAQSYQWQVDPADGPQRINIAYEPHTEIQDLGLLYLGAPGNSFAHVIEPAKTRFEDGQLWLHHPRQGQRMDLRMTYRND